MSTPLPSILPVHLRKWFSDIHEYGFAQTIIHNSLPIHGINTPSEFRILPKVLEELKEKYNSEKEKGGILIARPISKQKKKYFEIYDVFFLRNIKPAHEQKYSYWFDERDLQNAFDRCFLRGENKRISFPIFFHTHPTFDLDHIHSSLKYFTQVSTSEDDEGLAHNMVRNYKGESFAMPNALVVINPKLQGQFFIGFFGGYIAPESFTEYMLKVTGKTLVEIKNDIVAWAGKDEVKQVALAAITVVLLGTGLYYAETVIPFLLLLYAMNIIPLTATYFDEKPNYFSQVFDCEKILSIHIPKYS